MKTLYIIGNGFDLHHYLKTSYYDFSIYLRESDRKLYDILEKFISYPTSDKDLWAKFEENLANLDAEEILSENSNYLPDYGSEEFRDKDRYAFPDTMQQYYERLTEGLFDDFTMFIGQVEFASSSYTRKIELDRSATFLTFNYTETLEKLYSIDRSNIVYIHNSAFEGKKIVLGHGINPETYEEKILEHPDDIEPEQLEDWYNSNISYDYSYDEGKKLLMQYFKETFKPTNEIISKHINFFNALVNIEEVIVLGHSISQVDLPYFTQIVQSVKSNVKWTISFYNTDEYKRHLKILNGLNIDHKNVKFIQLVDLLESNRQLKLDF
ncbi:MAG: hypothetical protein DI598_11350 [Pseudopedobacter saltans]|uniref:Bacteriophage abortive infection AbiH n=1 Tax=Pseudopedobacter saltans TaxID=151895 RepID=A0A2W5ESZ4_9SPHI|nr:MAG: hypothetical protein DI598_11350 [Pseudopedobacter saltans]